MREFYETKDFLRQWMDSLPEISLVSNIDRTLTIQTKILYKDSSNS